MTPRGRSMMAKNCFARPGVTDLINDGRGEGQGGRMGRPLSTAREWRRVGPKRYRLHAFDKKGVLQPSRDNVSHDRPSAGVAKVKRPRRAGNHFAALRECPAVLRRQQFFFFFDFSQSSRGGRVKIAIALEHERLLVSNPCPCLSDLEPKLGGNLLSIAIRGSVPFVASGHRDRRLTECPQMVMMFVAFARRLLLSFEPRHFVGIALMVAPLVSAPAMAQDPAQDARAEQARLAQLIAHHPTDYESTYRYVLLSTELKDYEAAIGALERLLMFNPGLSRADKELGFLYARLGAYQLAAQHLRKALASGDLDPVQVAQIESHLPDIEKQNAASRWYGRLQVGIRSQSNADFFPAAGLFRVGGIDRFSISPRQSDFNAFELGEVAHDLDFQNQRGDKFETRISGYATQQFNLDRYNVGLLSVSAGPRLALAPDDFPGVGVKPYVTGLVSYLGSINYLNSGGAGVSLFAPIGPMFSVEPGFEWRALSVSSRGLFASVATLGTGDALRGYVTGVLKPDDDVKLETRLSFTRGNAALSSQSFDQIEAQAMLRVDFDPPLDIIGRKWTLAPYGRVFQIAYDSPNIFVDPFRSRRDVAWTTGLAFEAPFTPNFGFASSVEFSRNNSNLPNFRSHNLSVSFGPVAKF
jgi:hypothetical protein